MVPCHAVEYHFTNREDMQKSIDAGEFIEWAEYSGNLYGTRYILCNLSAYQCTVHIFVNDTMVCRACAANF